MLEDTLHVVWKDSVTKERRLFFLFKETTLYFSPPHTFLHKNETGNHVIISISAEEAFDKIY